MATALGGCAHCQKPEVSSGLATSVRASGELRGEHGPKECTEATHSAGEGWRGSDMGQQGEAGDARARRTRSARRPEGLKDRDLGQRVCWGTP